MKFRKKKEAKKTQDTMTLNEKVDKLMEYFESGMQSRKSKSKGYRLPFKTKRAMKHFEKKNKILIFLLTTNRTIKTITTHIIKGMIKLNDNWHSVPANAVWLYHGKMPAIVLEEWDLQALTQEELYGDSVEKKRMIDPQTIIIRAIKAQEILEKSKKLGGKALIWIIIGGIAVAYILFTK